MGFRCYWCDADHFQGVQTDGSYMQLDLFQAKGDKPVDYICSWCGHLLSQGNPRAGDPEETVESLKLERDQIRKELTQVKEAKAKQAKNRT